jgi:hypothetical protein
VAGEGDAEHLVRLALVPRRAREQVHHRLDHRVVAGHPGPQQQTVPPPRRPQMRDDGEPLVQLVDRGQPVEEVAAQRARVPRRADRRPPAGGRHVHHRTLVAGTTAGHACDQRPGTADARRRRAGVGTARWREAGGTLAARRLAGHGGGAVVGQHRDEPLTDLFGRHAGDPSGKRPEPAAAGALRP